MIPDILRPGAAAPGMEAALPWLLAALAIGYLLGSRIPSYNVCYTKLLRHHQEDQRRGRDMLDHRADHQQDDPAEAEIEHERERLELASYNFV